MESPSDSVIARRIGAIPRRPLHWLWSGWLARGVLTLLDGDPGMGKSTLTAEWAARLSRGQPLAVPVTGSTPNPTTVMIVSAEDDPARVLRPRLEAAKADLQRVLIVDGIGPEELPVQLPEHLPALVELIVKENVGLVIIDPLMAFLGRGVAASSDQQVRRALHRIKQAAEHTQCAFVIVRHLNKSSAMSALYRGGGSIGIIGACRVALVLGKDPVSDEGRVLAMNKNNLARKPPSVRFHLEQSGGACVVAWDGECDWTADEILGKMSEQQAEALSRVAECADYLQRLFGGETVMARDLDTAGRAGGFTEITIRRARKKMGARASKHATLGWMVQVPARGRGQ
jgi:RecA-family ATPase